MKYYNILHTRGGDTRTWGGSTQAQRGTDPRTRGVRRNAQNMLLKDGTDVTGCDRTATHTEVHRGGANLKIRKLTQV